MSPDVHLLGSSPSTVGDGIDMDILSVDDNDDEIMHVCLKAFVMFVTKCINPFVSVNIVH